MCVRLLPLIAAVWALCPAEGRAAAIESVNAGSSPNASGSWSAVDIGWLYTPGLTYSLTGIETKFRTADQRTVTLEVYSAAPPQGGILLRSANFIPAAGLFAGASFDPLPVNAGQQFFIGFRNVAGLGVNTTTADQGMQSLGPDYYDLDGSGSYALHFPFTTGDVDRPILLLNGTAVPEPATYMLVGLALSCCAAGRRAKRSPGEGPARKLVVSGFTVGKQVAGGLVQIAPERIDIIADDVAHSVNYPSLHVKGVGSDNRIVIRIGPAGWS
jgi:hypothetical protein